MEKPKTGFSFSFAKKKDNKPVFKPSAKLVQSGRDEDDERIDFVTSIDDKEIQSSAPKRKEQELVIPLIKNNHWRIPRDKRLKKSETKEEEKEEDKADATDLDTLAKKALLLDAEKANESWRNRGKKDLYGSLEIPLMFQNQVPGGFEEEGNFDVSIRPEEPTLDDYEAVPVEQFGLAMLRGMGWKPGQPIGKTNKAVVEIVEPRMRARGLGLGAEAPKHDSTTSSSTHSSSGSSSKSSSKDGKSGYGLQKKS